MQQVLIVEDDREIAQLVETTLTREGFICRRVADGRQAIATFQDWQPDVIVLDLMLPELDGLEVCTRIRQQFTHKDPYILMLTARGEEIDRVIGLSTGADDYLTKPFSPRELVARVRALLRRSLRHGDPQAPAAANVYRSRHFSVDLDRHVASRQLAGETEPQHLELTQLEFKLLAAFLSYPGRAWTRLQLIEKLWGDDFFGDERVVDTHIGRLRKKVEPEPTQPSFIKTVVGVGYKFEDERS
ncbi:MAG: response regulator transcription factor [Spirulinaceae cyanobacterium RM2_2_10]|nr:response regulator transcription factor [Spirulinaceae cyanobacterium SM2_1_0]NJO20587.1 response regulator transcription factor [Spirulinaceae cyanobacterium RM2_2_10]